MNGNSKQESVVNKNLTFKFLAGALVFLAGTGMAIAENSNYLGLQYGVAKYSESGVSKDFEPTAVIARFGREINPNFAVEGRLGIGLDDDTQFVPELCECGVDVEFEIDSIFGIYAKGSIHPSDWLSLYGLVGGSRVKVTAGLAGFSSTAESDDENSLSYGAGVDIGFSRSAAVNIEYMRYLDKDNFSLDMASIGLTFRF
jgi:outer membrane immunogenic protein